MSTPTLTTNSTLPALPEDVRPPNLGDLIPHATAREMARVYVESTANLRRYMDGMDVESQKIRSAFLKEEKDSTFNITFTYNNSHRYSDGNADMIFTQMKKEAWRVLVDRLGIKNIMSVKKRNEFERQLEDGRGLPEITEDTIVGVLCGLVDQARDFARDAAAEVFDLLRPRGHWGGQYKTNDGFRVGRKVILSWYVEACWSSIGGRFRVNHGYDRHLIAIDGVFHLLDGKGIMREHLGPLVSAINSSPDGRGETEYFRFKCYKNRNLHLEMKRLDLVRQLNLLAAGEAVLGNDLVEGE